MAAAKAGVFAPGSEYARLAAALFDEARALGLDGAGVTRASYGEGETRLLAHLRDRAAALGLATHDDAAGNLWISPRGHPPDTPRIVSGSHADSVPRGGNFDGFAGVVAALLCVLRHSREPVESRRPLAALALRGEESAWFGKAYLGSTALLGALSRADLDRRHRDGAAPLERFMLAAGADPGRCSSGVPLPELATMAAFLELHIEQGPLLEEADRPVGVVTGIRGNFRYRRVRCEGEAGHSGTVPRRMRRDAVFAVCDLLSRIEEAWEEWLAQGQDLVVTSGMIHTDPATDAPSVIAGEASFSLEVRSRSAETLERFHRSVLDECEALAQARGVRFDFGERIDSAPAVMDEALTARLAEICRARALPFVRMPSGAGHDAAVFANAGVPSGMLFVRNSHGSHNPKESMRLEDFLLGAEVLYECMTRA